MHKLISLYNQNRRKFWVMVLAVCVIGFIVWRLLFILTENNNTVTPNVQEDVINNDELNSISMSNQQSAITGQAITNTQEEISTVDNFISYCNSGNVQEAYNLLSNECKEVMFPELANFQEIYYNSVFGQGKNNVKVQNWVGDTYKIDFENNLLASGGRSTEGNTQDYITIVKDKDGNDKLNINNYIRREEINKSKSIEDIADIKVVSKDIYMDYEVYTFEVTNNKVTIDEFYPATKIALGDSSDEDMSYLTDENGLQYNAFSNEIAQYRIVVNPGNKTTVQIKYANQFSSERKIKSVVFPKFIFDYDDYAELNNKNLYVNKETVEIEL